MVWVRLDDNISEHPKIAALDDHAFSLFVAGLAYCNRNMTDGFIPSHVGIGQLRYSNGNTIPAIRQLEEIGLWQEEDGGWRVHDYDDYQPSKAQVEAERAQKKAAGKAGGLARAKARAKQVLGQEPSKSQASAQAESKPVPVPVPVPGKDLEPRDLKARQEPRTEKPRTPTETQAFLLQKLVDRDSRWDELWGLLTKLNAQMTRPIVTTALQHLVESDAPAERPPALLVDTCKRIREEQAS